MRVSEGENGRGDLNKRNQRVEGGGGTWKVQSVREGERVLVFIVNIMVHGK